MLFGNPYSVKDSAEAKKVLRSLRESKEVYINHANHLKNAYDITSPYDLRVLRSFNQSEYTLKMIIAIFISNKFLGSTEVDELSEGSIQEDYNRTELLTLRANYIQKEIERRLRKLKHSSADMQILLSSY